MTASAGPVLRQLYREFRNAVEFITLYVREAHPGENHPQPQTIEQKIRHAREYANRDALPWLIAVDGIEGELHRALDAKPNCAYLVNIDGKVASRVLWANQIGPLRGRLRLLAQRQRLSDGQHQGMIVPLLRGMGQMQETLREAGGEAQSDVRRAVPPIYALAKLADLFRPLPPLARGFAAAATVAVGVGVIAAVSWRLFGRRR